jgi:4-hydroxy-tetrahydrodipicolinate synthase
VGVSLLTLFHGNGDLDAPATATLAAKLVDHGIRCVVVADWAGEGMALARDVPVIAAHNPSVSLPGLKIEDLPHLRVAGIADSSGEPVRLLETLELVDVPVYVGSAAVLALAGPSGATGAILALANADPERCVAAFEGNGTAQRELTKEHMAIHVDFPRRVKELTARRFGTSSVSRMG